MIRHIVLYRLKEQDKEQNARTMKEKLEGLNGKIEGDRKSTRLNSSHTS